MPPSPQSITKPEMESLKKDSQGGLWAGCIEAHVHGFLLRKLEIHTERVKAAASTPNGGKRSGWAAGNEAAVPQ